MKNLLINSGRLIRWKIWMFDYLHNELHIQALENFELMQEDNLPQASVIVLIKLDEEPKLVMAQKAAHLRKHAGEVVFPGGKLENNESHLTAALRECYEEIGLQAEVIDVVGCLSRYETRYNIAVYPFVGVLNKTVTYQLDNTEMQAVFEVPLSFLCQADNLLQETVSYRGSPKTIYYFQYEQYKIWGITALIIKELVGL